MKRFGILICMAVIAMSSCARKPRMCEVCQREECVGLAFRVTLENGRQVETCCARCGLHYLQSRQQTAREMQATDFDRGGWMDASDAVFVVGSDVSPCAGMETRRDAQGCCYTKGFDRCLPSVIAFRDRQAADAFTAKHGGEVSSLASLK